MGRWRWGAVGAAAVLLACVLFSWKWWGTASAAGPSLFRYEPGVRLVHRIDYRSEGESDFLPLFGQGKERDAGRPPLALSQSFRSGVRGDLLLEILEWRDVAWVASFRVDRAEVSFAVDGTDDPAQTDAIRTGLSGGWFARISPEGRILSVRMDPSMSDLSKRYAQTLLGAIQVVFPGKEIPASGRWEVAEEDSSGRGVVLYERVEPGKGAPAAGGEAGDTVSLGKTRLRYDARGKKRGPVGFSPEQAVLPSGSVAIRFDLREGSVVSMAGTEGQEVRMGGKRIGRAENSVRLDLVRRGTAPPAERKASLGRYEALAGAGMDAALSTNLAAEAGRLALERRALGASTAESLRAELEASAREPGGMDMGLFRKLQALFRLQPQACADFVAFVKRGNPGSSSVQIVWGALATVGNSRAQDAMVDVLKSRRDDLPAVYRLLSSVPDVESPGPALVATVREIAFRRNGNDQGAGLLTIGALARNLAAERPSEAGEIVAALSGELDRSTSEGRTRTLLLALGNAGSADALPAIRKHLSDPSAALRAAAVSALRWVETEEAETRIIQALASDPDEAVRMKAVAALGFREPTRPAVDGQRKAVLKDGAPAVRFQLVRNLSAAAARFPDAAETLRRVSGEDPSEDVRNAAGQALTELRDTK